MRFPPLLTAILVMFAVAPQAEGAAEKRVARTQGVEVVDSFGPVVAWSEAVGGRDSIAERLVMLRDGKVTRLPVRRLREGGADVAVGPGVSGEPVIVYTRSSGTRQRPREAVYRFDPVTARETRVPGATVNGSCFVRGFPWEGRLLLVSVAAVDGPHRCQNRVDLVRAGKRTRVPIPGRLADAIVDFNGSRVLTIASQVMVHGIDGHATVLARQAARGAYFQPDFGQFDSAGRVVFELFDEGTERTRLIRVSDTASPALEAGPAGCNLEGPLAHDGTALIVSDGFVINRIVEPVFRPIPRMPSALPGRC